MNTSESARYLLSILTEMGKKNTNPVLLALPDPKHIELKHKYHIPPFQTNNFRFKSFYHCHVYPDKKETEHGHFHFFVKQKQSEKWQHLAALSMNNQGQPEQWLTVNQWVTDSDWIEVNDFDSLFKELSNLESDDLLHEWIIAIIILYRDQLRELIEQRDQQLSLIKTDINDPDIINNRDIYRLSGYNIFLEDKLNEHISVFTSQPEEQQ